MPAYRQMPAFRQSYPREFALGVALVSGMCLSVAAQTVLAHLGLDLAAVWRGLRGPQSAQLRAAFAWWLIAGASFLAGFIVALLVKYFVAHPVYNDAVRWSAGIAGFVVLTFIAHGAATPPGLSPAASVGIGLAVMCLAAILSALGAYFVVRRG
ncbi:MAG: hypothetical protein U1E81_13055 [Xanthobacteraceae bacterium]